MILSVIVPAYNVEEYIENCIESIIEQKNSEFELIVVDDGSADRTFELAKKYESDNVKVLTQKNQGSGVARNTGLKAAIGKYVYFVDPDDSLVNGMFQDIFHKINEKSFDIIQFSYSFRSENGEIWNQSKLASNEIECHSNNEIVNFMYTMSKETNIYTVWSKLINRTFLLENNIFYTNQKTGQDALFTIDLFKNAETLLWIPKRYYYYLKDRSSSAQNKKNYSTIIDDNKILTVLHDFQKNKNINRDLYSGFAVNILDKELRYIASDNDKYAVFKSTINNSILNNQLSNININNLSWKKKIVFLVRKHSNIIFYIYYRYMRLKESGKK